MVGQTRNISLASVFKYQLCGVPAYIIDEFGLFCSWNKATLVKKLAVMLTNPHLSNEVIIDASQLLYHIFWPCGGTVISVATSLEAKFQVTKGIATKVIFDRYGRMSAKDHEVSRCSDITRISTYNLTLTSPLPSGEIILKAKINIQTLYRLLCKLCEKENQ